MLTQEQIRAVKKQLIAHIEEGFPEDKKDYAVKQIESMGAEQLEEFLKQNNLSTEGPSGGSKCIFCSITSREMPSYKIAENGDALAVLEINPLSRGHVIIIPKKHVDSSDKIPRSVLALAKEVENKIKAKLNPENTNVRNSNMFGHEIVNVIPIYKEDLDSGKSSERYHATDEELLSLQKILLEEEKPLKISRKKPKTKKIQKGKKIILPRRIP